MTLISENTTLFLFIFILATSLITYFVLSFRRLRNHELNKLNAVFSEIEVEKNTKLSLQNTSKKIEDLELHTKTSFLKINIAIFNLDFSYKEVLSKI